MQLVQQCFTICILIISTVYTSQGQCTPPTSIDEDVALNYKTNRYIFSNDGGNDLSWDASSAACRAKCGVLATITDQTLQDLLLDRARDLDYSNVLELSNYWIGARVLNTTSGVSWEEDGVSSSFQNFKSSPTEPGCVSLDAPDDGEWVIVPCSRPRLYQGYICQLPNGSKKAGSGIELTLALIGASILIRTLI